MKSVKIIARVGTEIVPLGACHPAQARVLVKDELAVWEDGQIRVLLRPAFANLLDNNEEAWRGPKDNEHVSKMEMERRIAWFKHFMGKAVPLLAKTSKSAPESHRAHYEKLSQPRSTSEAGLLSSIDNQTTSYLEDEAYFDESLPPPSDSVAQPLRKTISVDLATFRLEPLGAHKEKHTKRVKLTNPMDALWASDEELLWGRDKPPYTPKDQNRAAYLERMAKKPKPEPMDPADYTVIPIQFGKSTF